jgi:hypothetical protein
MAARPLCSDRLHPLARHVDTPILQAVLQIVLGGVIVLAVGI